MVPIKRNTEAHIEQRAQQPYVGVRTQVPMQEMKNVIPEMDRQVYTWLRQRGIKPTGASILRYHVINMDRLMDIESGVPVAEPIPDSAFSGEDAVKAGVLPAGQYATLIFTGVQNGIQGNAALLDWGAEQGLVWDRWDTPEGDAFRSRYESYLTDPVDEPDPSKWEIEVAIRLADAPGK